MTRTQPNELPKIKSELNGVGLKIGIVFSRFNSSITSDLLQGAKTTLLASGVQGSDIEIIDVPGALEIPYAAQLLAKSDNFDALIAIGCVVRGETSHYDIVSTQAAEGINQVSLNHGIPITFGVLTTENFDQAKSRSGGDKGNLGSEAARAAIDIASLTKKRFNFKN